MAHSENIDRKRKAEFLKDTIQHIDITQTNVVDMVEAMEKWLSKHVTLPEEQRYSI